MKAYTLTFQKMEKMILKANVEVSSNVIHSYNRDKINAGLIILQDALTIGKKLAGNLEQENKKKLEQITYWDRQIPESREIVRQCSQNISIFTSNKKTYADNIAFLQKNIARSHENLALAQSKIVIGNNLLASLNPENFYDIVEVREKHSTRILGIRGEPYYTYRHEKQLNPAKYQAKLQSYKNDLQKVHAFINENNQYLAKAKQELLTTEKNLAAIPQQILDNEQRVKFSQSVIDHITSQMPSALKSMEELKVMIIEIHATIEQIELAKTSFTSQLNYLNDLYDKIDNADLKGRANLVAELIDEENAVQVTHLIEEKGLDNDYLAYLAIQSNHSKLTEYVFALNVDWNQCIIPELHGKSLLQHAIHLNRDNVVNRALSIMDSDQLKVSVINAVKQDDTITLTKLLEHDISLVQAEIDGYSLIDYAFMNSKYEIAAKILQLAPNAVNISDTDDKSTLEIAIETGIQNVQLIAPYLDMEKESKKLVRSNKLELIQKLSDMNILSSQVLQNLLKEAVHCSNNEIASYLITKGLDTEAVFRSAMASNDLSLIDYLTEYDDHLLHEDFLSSLQLEEGYQNIAHLIGNISL